MNRVVVTGALLAMSVVASADWNFLGTFGGRDFYLNSAQDTYVNHRADAAANNLVLASIRSQAENDWVRGMGVTGQTFIGFTDEVAEGNFVWEDGWTGSFTFWAPGEPNNVNNEDATVMNWNGSGQWNDVQADNPNFASPAIATAVPEPATIAALGIGCTALLRRRRARKA